MSPQPQERGSPAPGAPVLDAASDAPERTLDLAELARIARGDRVEVQPIRDKTQDLFEQTIALVEGERGAEVHVPGQGEAEQTFVPENEDLRKLYFFAEAVGGYEMLHDLFSTYSPGQVLSRKYKGKAGQVLLSEDELRTLEGYQAQINEAIRNATAYLRETALRDFDAAELHELYQLLVIARGRANDITRILGMHLMLEIESAVERLNHYQEKIRHVEPTVSGIFLVNSEVMFVPTNELVRIVNNMFKAMGNAYLAEHIDGVLLLAARNLLIDVASFHAYYGKHQIYNLFRRGGSTLNAAAVAGHVRREIRKLFEACMRDNRLVLTRIMKDAVREFEISADAIQREAEQEAVRAVKLLMPSEPAPPPPPRPGWLRRVLGWLLR